MMMMTRREAAVMVMVMVMVALLVMSESCVGWYPYTRTLRIVNGMRTQLRIHCRSKDKDMGARVLSFMDRFQWDFRDELWGTTRFSCDLWYTWRRKQRNGNFVVYDTDNNENLRMHPCRDLCEWLVKGNGIYAFDIDDGVWDFELAWSGWDDDDPGVGWISVLHKIK